MIGSGQSKDKQTGPKVGEGGNHGSENRQTVS